MQKRKQVKASELKGIGIYQDPKKGTIIYDWLTKKGYQITTSDVGTYTVSKAFFPIGIITFYLFHNMIGVKTLTSLIIAVAIYIALKIIYRIKFLNNLPAIENYKRPGGSNIFDNAAAQYTKKSMIVVIVMSIALIILSIIYIKTTQLDTIELIGFILLTLAAILLFIYFVIALIKKNRGNN